MAVLTCLPGLPGGPNTLTKRDKISSLTRLEIERQEKTQVKQNSTLMDLGKFGFEETAFDINKICYLGVKNPTKND